MLGNEYLTFIYLDVLKLKYKKTKYFLLQLFEIYFIFDIVFTDSPMADEDTSLTFPMSKSPSTRSEDRGHPERKRRASEDSCEVRETIIGNSN